MANTEMKPCPFCGSTDVGGGGGVAHCYRCGASITRGSTIVAVDAWNTRASATNVGECVPDESQLFLHAESLCSALAMMIGAANTKSPSPVTSFAVDVVRRFNDFKAGTAPPACAVDEFKARILEALFNAMDSTTDIYDSYQAVSDVLGRIESGEFDKEDKDNG